MSHGSTTTGPGRRSSEELPAQFHDMLIRLLGEGREVTQTHGGAYFPDEENPGKHVVEVLTKTGAVTFYDATRTDDYQSGPVGAVPPAEKIRSEELTLPAVRATPEDCWLQACNSELPPSDRVRTLQECLLADNSRAVDMIVDELCLDDVSDDWRDALIYAAENVHFRDSAQQAKVRSRLRELALGLREVSRAGTDHVVWSALRRFSSLMPPEKANELVEFLDRKGVVDTRMVALQCVARVFHAGPPSDAPALEPLTLRVAEYAEKFLDQDVFGGGENSSIARNAVLALAALGSPKLDDSVARVNALGRRWLSRRVQIQLQELLDGWKNHDRESENSSAFKVVERALKSVRTDEAG